MEIELLPRLRGAKLSRWKALLARGELEADLCVESTVLIWDGDTLIASGSRQGNLLKCIAVDPDRQGEGLTATVLTALRQDAFQAGHRHLFLYTKPHNRFMFSSLFFYPIAQTEDVLLMEDKADGIGGFLRTLPAAQPGTESAAIVMNCNPFTLGHRYLIEQASRECSQLYVFVLSEDKSRFSAADRIEMVRRGTADLSNVAVLPTGPYLISSATFPTYFLKDRENAGQVQCLLDVEIFVRYYAPRFGITCRYVGTEPLSPMTDQYNRTLRRRLPECGIALRELSRLEKNGAPVSASAVRTHLDAGNIDAVRDLVPSTTFDYLQTRGLL